MAENVRRPDAPVLEALRGEQQVYREGAAQPADHHEQLDEVRVGRDQFAELVDHHEQGGQRVERGALGARLLVVADRTEVPGPAQQFLPTDQFAVHSGLHPVDQGGLVGQVGDQRRHVRNPVQSDERGAALEVDEDEVQGLRGVRGGQGQHEGA